MTVAALKLTTVDIQEMISYFVWLKSFCVYSHRQQILPTLP